MDVKPIPSILHILDPDSALHTPRPDSKWEDLYTKLQKSFAQLQEENRRLKDKLEESELQSKTLKDALQKVDTQSHRYYSAAATAQHERDKLQEEADILKHVEKRVQILEVLVDDAVSPFLDSLDTFKNRAISATNLLFVHASFKYSEAFEDEKQEALADILSWLGAPLVHMLVTYEGKAAARGSVGGSQILIRVASWALLCRHLCRCLKGSEYDKPVSKASLLKRYINMFKIASWELSGAKTRFAFEAKLESVLSSETRIKRLYPGVDIWLHLPAAKADYNPTTMEAVDVVGRPLAAVPKGSQKIAAALGFGAKTNTKVALRPQVLLMSTLQDALDEEERLLRKQPCSDGRD